MVLRKLILDQTIASPLATSVFYTGVSFLEGKEDVLKDWRDKFLNTYKNATALPLIPVLDEYPGLDWINIRAVWIFGKTIWTGLTYWPFMQFLNFVLVPVYLRTAVMGCSAFLWATFLCFSQESGDGTATVALAWLLSPRAKLPPLDNREEK